MKPMRLLSSMLFAALVMVCVAASPALASSPTALVLPGEPLPIALNGPSDNPNNGIQFELQNAALTIKGDGLLLGLTLTSASAGTYQLLYLKVGKGAEQCSTAGDAAGEELLGTNTFALVHRTATEGVEVLFNVSEFTVECGAAKLKVKGNFLGLLGPVGGGEKTSFTMAVHCSGTVGEPAETKYFNSAGMEEIALLLDNLGTGFKKGCVEWVPATISLTANKMMELMN